MPLKGRPHDIELNGKGYMLQRQGQFRGRAWRRSGQSDTPERRLPNAAEYGNLPGEVDHVEVWDDWSGGFGDAYRDPQNPNRYHWSENFDARFPHQLVHAQAPRLMPSFAASFSTRADGFIDSPFWPQPTPDFGLPAPNYVFPAVAIMGYKFIAFIRPAAMASLANEPTLNHQPLGALPSYYAMPSTTFSNVLYFGAFQQASTNVLNRGFLWLTRGITSNEGPLVGQGLIAAGNRLWRYFGDTIATENITRVSSFAGGAVGSGSHWSATLNVGNGSDDARSMIALDDQVFVGMADGLYAGDQSGTFVNVMPDLVNQKHRDNCRDLTIYQGGVVAPHVGGIYWYRPFSTTAVNQEIGPQGVNNNRSPLTGYTRTVRTFGKWLHAGFWTGSQSYLMAGLIPTDGGQPIWHTMQRLPHVAKVHRIHFDGITTTSSGDPIPNRMWIATDASIATNGTAPVYWMPVPQMYGNPLAAGGPFLANYTMSARMDLPNTDWGAPATPKVFRAVEVWADNLGTARWANVYYSVDDGARTLLGTINVSPKQTLFFPHGEGSFVTGQSIALSLESFIASGHTATTPVYRAILQRGTIRGKVAAVITAAVRIADDIRNRAGAPMRPAAVMLTELHALESQASPVRLIDPTGAENWVVVQGAVEEQEVEQKGDDAPELAALVRMSVLEFSGGA